MRGNGVLREACQALDPRSRHRITPNILAAKCNRFEVHLAITSNATALALRVNEARS